MMTSDDDGEEGFRILSKIKITVVDVGSSPTAGRTDSVSIAAAGSHICTTCGVKNGGFHRREEEIKEGETGFREGGKEEVVRKQEGSWT